MNDFEKYFGEHNGFGKHKETAIELLKETINILNKYNINYFIISGTLLGHVRHNDFIPWDDDIDIIVEDKILDLLQDIHDTHKNKINILTRGNYIVKFCFKNKVKELEHPMWKDFLLDKTEKYNWPFIDLFTFKYQDDKIIFFDKQWDANKFFPEKQELFNGLFVNIPNDAHYFLEINYGSNYMDAYISTNYCHKDERIIEKRAGIGANVYKKIKHTQTT